MYITLRRRRAIGRGLLFVLALLVAPEFARAALVAPHALFMTHGARPGELTIGNQSDLPEEITIGFRYGFPEGDSLGRVAIRYADSLRPEDPAATPWLRATPRRFVLAPRTSQKVRIVATPPADLPDGEYWSRVVVSSHPIAARPTDSTGVQVGVTMGVQTVGSVTYRKGRVRTAVSIDSVRARLTGDSLVVRAALRRSQEGAFLGTVRLTLRDGAGAIVAEGRTLVAVYYVLDRELNLRLPAVPARGTRFTLEIAVSTERTDIPARDILPAPSVVQHLTIDAQ